MLAGSVMSQDVTHPRGCPWASGLMSWVPHFFGSCQTSLTHVVAPGPQGLMSWVPHFFGSCQFLARSHRALPRAACKILSCFPSMRSKRGFKWKPLPISIQISKGTAHSFCHILFVERSQSIRFTSRRGGYPRPFLRSRDQWRYHGSYPQWLYSPKMKFSKLRTAFKIIAHFFPYLFLSPLKTYPK